MGTQGKASIEHDRRGFLRSAAMTIAAAHLGVVRAVDANDRGPREVALTR